MLEASQPIAPQVPPMSVVNEKTAQSPDLSARNTGYYLLGQGYRAYSPVLMRFTSADSWSPFGRGGLNAYAYCLGDPVNAVDPSGHAPWIVKLFSRFLHRRPRAKNTLPFPALKIETVPETPLGARKGRSSSTATTTTSLSSFPSVEHVSPAAVLQANNGNNVHFPPDVLKHLNPRDLTSVRSTSRSARDQVDAFSQKNFDEYNTRPASFRPSHEKGLASPVENVIAAGMGELPGIAISQASKQMSLSTAKALYKNMHNANLTVRVGILRREETFLGGAKPQTHVMVRVKRA